MACAPRGSSYRRVCGVRRWGVRLQARGGIDGSPLLINVKLRHAFDTRFSLQDDGSCVSCPAYLSTWERYRGILYIVVALVVAVVGVWLLLLLLVYVRGGTLASGAARMLDLGVWGLFAAQVRGCMPGE